MDGDTGGEFESFIEAKRCTRRENYAKSVLQSCIGQLEAALDKGAYFDVLQPVVDAANAALVHVRTQQEDRMEKSLNRKKEKKNDRED